MPSSKEASEAFIAAVQAAEKVGLVWRNEPLVAKPTKPLADLIRQQGIQ